MKTVRIAVAGFLAVSLSMLALAASDRGKEDKDHGNRLRATLIGYDEVPSVNTPASGRFRARISDDGQSIDYTLTFSGIVTPVQQSHIHFAQKSVNGSIVVWLCQGVLRAPASFTLRPSSPGVRPCSAAYRCGVSRNDRGPAEAGLYRRGVLLADFK